VRRIVDVKPEASKEVYMLPVREWITPVLGLALIVVILLFGTRRGERRRSADDAQVRHEVIDECFAKGEMTREECESGCVSRGDCGQLASGADSCKLPGAGAGKHRAAAHGR
jgi:hypothetical protein